jgi:hypothetical protein
MTLTMASPFAYTPFWAFNEEQFPCNCCSASAAMEYGHWECANSGKEWQIVDSDFQSWGDMVYAEMQQRLAAETPEQRQKRLNAEAAKALLDSMAVQSYEMQVHAERMGIIGRQGVRRGEDSRKIQRPCKWLYCDDKAPKSQWHKDKDGKLCAPRRDHMTGAECWAWEYVDPKTKQHKKPHTCPYLHPGEPGWCKEWVSNSRFDPNASATQNRFSALRGKGCGHSH